MTEGVISKQNAEISALRRAIGEATIRFLDQPGNLSASDAAMAVISLSLELAARHAQGLGFDRKEFAAQAAMLMKILPALDATPPGGAVQ